jgi:hypothetical protein
MLMKKRLPAAADIAGQNGAGIELDRTQGGHALAAPSPDAADVRRSQIDTEVDRSLCMIIHHDEVQIIADIIKRVLYDRSTVPHPAKE